MARVRALKEPNRGLPLTLRGACRPRGAPARLCAGPANGALVASRVPGAREKPIPCERPPEIDWRIMAIARAL